MASRKREKQDAGQLVLLEVPLVVPIDSSPAGQRRAAQRRLSAAVLSTGWAPWLAWDCLMANLTGHVPSWWRSRFGSQWLARAQPSFHLAVAAAAERAAQGLGALQALGEPVATISGAEALQVVRQAVLLELESRGLPAIEPIPAERLRLPRSRQLELLV